MIAKVINITGSSRRKSNVKRKRNEHSSNRNDERQSEVMEDTLERQMVSDDVTHNNIPCRNCDNLYACQSTVHCALQRYCVPCSYKIGCFDVALDTAFCRMVPNQRPEMCPRLHNNQQPRSDRTIQPLHQQNNTFGYDYNDKQSFLTIGDGDLTFSLAIARILLKGHGSIATIKSSCCKVIATSYESRETLHELYPDIDKTIQELEQLGADVYYNVDATRIVETLPLYSSETLKKTMVFHRIVWNFPCEAVANGKDGQNGEMENNKLLIQKFVQNALPILHRTDGQIHINHKTKVCGFLYSSSRN